MSIGVRSSPYWPVVSHPQLGRVLPGLVVSALGNASATHGSPEEDRSVALSIISSVPAGHSTASPISTALPKTRPLARCAPSSFLKELAPEFLERIDLLKLLNTPVAEASAKSRFAGIVTDLGLETPKELAQ